MPVVDASVVVDWVAPDVDGGPARRLLSELVRNEDTLIGPRLLREEVGNALLTGVRRRRWTGSQADAAYALLQRLPLGERDVPADRDRAYDLARRYDEHPLYDLVYVALAERLQLPLVTADSRLLARVGHLPFVRALDDVVPPA
ncbi:MAG TPA: type II toxin-antitoxin system VapC family toxin [Mycobacteriales bacterium]|nr:type II toxin-antitoxin system VapC family toxin [Mycobacteriales bacterium]